MTNPNWVLAEARSAVDDFRNATSVSEVERAASKLADNFDALDDWLLKGGFLPADWLLAIRVPQEDAAGPINAHIVISEVGYQQLVDEMTEEEEAAEVNEGEADLLHKIFTEDANLLKRLGNESEEEKKWMRYRRHRAGTTRR